MNLPQMKQILEQYFLLLNGKRPMTDDLDLGIAHWLKWGTHVKIIGLANELQIKNEAGTEFKDLRIRNLYILGNLGIFDTKILHTAGSGTKFYIKGYDDNLNDYITLATVWADSGWVSDENMSIERAGNITILPNKVFKPNLPIADPTNAGQLWNDAGTVKVSTG